MSNNAATIQPAPQEEQDRVIEDLEKSFDRQRSLLAQAARSSLAFLRKVAPDIQDLVASFKANLEAVDFFQDLQDSERNPMERLTHLRKTAMGNDFLDKESERLISDLNRNSSEQGVDNYLVGQYLRSQTITATIDRITRTMPTESDMFIYFCYSALGAQGSLRKLIKLPKQRLKEQYAAVEKEFSLVLESNSYASVAREPSLVPERQTGYRKADSSKENVFTSEEIQQAIGSALAQAGVDDEQIPPSSSPQELWELAISLLKDKPEQKAVFLSELFNWPYGATAILSLNYEKKLLSPTTSNFFS